MVKQNEKWKLVLLKYNLIDQTKRKLKKLPLKYNYSSGKMKWKI